MILLNELQGNVLIGGHIRLSDDIAIADKISVKGNVINGGTRKLPPYTGSYTVIPTSGEQILQTQGMSMTDNIVIEPIPSNYGLITWNGSFLTVS